MATVTSAKEWKKNRKEVPLDLPSGNTCLVQPIGLDAMMVQGYVPNTLLDIVETSLAKGKKGKAAEVDEAKMFSDILKDRDKVKDVFAMADAVTAGCVIEPPVRLHTYTNQDLAEGNCLPEQVGVMIPKSERKEDLVYTDEVDFDDKMFIMQFAMGGSRDLEQFRQATS